MLTGGSFLSKIDTASNLCPTSRNMMFAMLLTCNESNDDRVVRTSVGWCICDLLNESTSWLNRSRGGTFSQLASFTTMRGLDPTEERDMSTSTNNSGTVGTPGWDDTAHVDAIGGGVDEGEKLKDGCTQKGSMVGYVCFCFRRQPDTEDGQEKRGLGGGGDE